jgi:hypothetical protein
MGPEALRITSRIVVILWHGRTGVCATAACHSLIWLRRRSHIKPLNQAIPSLAHPISSCPPPPSLCAPSTTDMSANLYETLGVQRGVSEDQSMSNPRTCLVPPQCSPLFAVRKAYKKRALQTHPDRVPPEQKEIAGDEFRKVTLIHAPTLLGRSFMICFRSIMHTKCLSIPVSVRYVSV